MTKLWICVITIQPSYINGSTLIGLYKASTKDAAIEKAATLYVDRLGDRFYNDEARLKELQEVIKATDATGVDDEPIEIGSVPGYEMDEE